MKVYLVYSLLDRSYRQVVSVRDTYEKAHQDVLALTEDIPHLQYREWGMIKEFEVT